ncbi:hypothetical protein GGS23DRAFT_136754 [Durotheca rogersii]|uniref:uncharacterized protein n=1 Tax=Durotheca rogersii TaxID=419775 RepID=UPI00221F68E1|nr:uncharacterized protein GGS23DRAFT_136754 [Durotheca rogersii]KAI5861499.1 hypothetical protein GGS23DRAFT_136754 [Durotheca rogersii]
MSGRGRGRGGRGGFGGGRKAAPQGMPGGDEPGLMFNGEPQGTYPKYKVPVAPPLSPSEDRAVASFVAFRRAFHGTPFYTHRQLASNPSSSSAPSHPAAGPSLTESCAATAAASGRPVPPGSDGASRPVQRAYGQAQINARFSVRSRATLDPFTAVPLWSNRFTDEARVLPDLKPTSSSAARPRRANYIVDFFPDEVRATLEGRDAGGFRGGFLAARPSPPDGASSRGRRRPHPASGGHRPRRLNGHAFDDETEEQRKARVDAALKDGDQDAAPGEAGADGNNVDDEDEEALGSQEDDDYADDDDDYDGDYNAEAYFDDGADDDFGEEEGVGESAMDF